MVLDQIKSLCSHMNSFGERQNWRFKGLPVLVWEFATIEDFFGAKEQIIRAVAEHMVPDERLERLIGPDTCELDCFGVTLRLICKARIAIPGKGSFNVNDLTVDGTSRTIFPRR